MGNFDALNKMGYGVGWLIMQSQMIAEEAEVQCSIPFLECRGYYDLAGEIVTIVIGCFVLIKALGNYRDLKIELRLASQLAYGDNLRLKLQINLINVAFLVLLISQVIFSMVLFTVANEQNGNSIITDHKLQLWYQFTHLGVVELLNCLVVVIGWLYWKTLNSFYTLKGLRTPSIYSNCLHHLTVGILIFLVGIVVVSLIDSIWDYQGLQLVINWLVLASQIISTTFFITYRILYHKNIFSSVKLSRQAVRRENVHNFIIVLTSLGRIGLCILAATSVDFQSLRTYEVDKNNNNCQDVRPYHALLLLLIRVVIDILPAFVFTRIFTHKDKKGSSSAQQTLFSAQPSETSGI